MRRNIESGSIHYSKKLSFFLLLNLFLKFLFLYDSIFCSPPSPLKKGLWKIKISNKRKQFIINRTREFKKKKKNQGIKFRMKKRLYYCNEQGRVQVFFCLSLIETHKLTNRSEIKRRLITKFSAFTSFLGQLNIQ